MDPLAALAAITAVANMIDSIVRAHLARIEKMLPAQVQEEEARFLKLTEPVYKVFAWLADQIMKAPTP